MRRMFLPFMLMLVLAAFASGLAHAQDAPSIESIEVALWPEYDRPAMLGLYLVRLEAETDFPATVDLPLPEDVMEPHVVAAWFPDGRLDDNVEWQVNEQNGTRFVTVTVNTTGVWLEFYAPLNQEDTRRSYTFNWPGEVAANSFDFEVMHPVGATDVLVIPAGQESEGEDGLTYSRRNLGRLAPGDRPQIELSYSKSKPIPASISQTPGGPSALTLLEVAIWPEYDREDTLVIYRAQLPPETRLPARVTFPIPAQADEPHAVATIGEDRNLYVAPYELEPTGNWTWVTVESDSLLLQVEYYANLNITGSRRAFTFHWPGGMQVSTFQYEIQRPPSATALELTPSGVAQVGQDGLTYIRSALGSLESGDQLEISLAYEKSDGALSVDAVSAQPALERPTATQGGTPDLTDLLPWILGGFGALLAGVGLFMLLRIRTARPRISKSRRRKRRKAAEGGDLESSPIYCHVCGSEASASDLFCRRCGTKLRT